MGISKLREDFFKFLPQLLQQTIEKLKKVITGILFASKWKLTKDKFQIASIPGDIRHHRSLLSIQYN